MTQVTPIRDLKGYLEPKQVERLIAVAGNLRDKLLVRVPWRSGLRVSELIGIKVSDIDFVNRAITIKVQKMRKKDGKAIERRRIVPIDQGTLDMVKEYLEWRKQFAYTGDLLFPITRQRVDQIYWKLGRRVGIKEIGSRGTSHSPEALLIFSDDEFRRQSIARRSENQTVFPILYEETLCIELYQEYLPCFFFHFLANFGSTTSLS